MLSSQFYSSLSRVRSCKFYLCFRNLLSVDFATPYPGVWHFFRVREVFWEKGSERQNFQNLEAFTTI